MGKKKDLTYLPIYVTDDEYLVYLKRVIFFERHWLLINLGAIMFLIFMPLFIVPQLTGCSLFVKECENTAVHVIFASIGTVLICAIPFSVSVLLYFGVIPQPERSIRPR